MTFRTERRVPRLGVMLVGWGGNNGTTVTAAVLANSLGLTWRTKTGLQVSGICVPVWLFCDDYGLLHRCDCSEGIIKKVIVLLSSRYYCIIKNTVTHSIVYYDSVMLT